MTSNSSNYVDCCPQRSRRGRSTSPPSTVAEPLTLLRTKLHKPQIRRLLLVERLNQGLDRRLTLVSAPAGFGESTLVASSLAKTDRHTMWLSLDQGDNAPVRSLIWGRRDKRFIPRVDSHVNLQTRALLPSIITVLTCSGFRAILINTTKNTHIGRAR